MAERRDQLQSYQFVLQRVVSALVMRETDPVRSPFRKAAGAILAGTMVAVIALAGVGLFGLISPGGNTSWKTEGAVVIEDETGARFVYLNGQLHPVANYASALLIAKSANAKPVHVASASIAGAGRGKPLGIPGAPDSLPAEAKLLTRAWTLCSRTNKDKSIESVLYVGAAPGGGRPLGDAALLVRGGQEIFLVWHGYRYAVRDSAIILPALGFNSESTLVDAAPSWVNALPTGRDLARMALPGRGGAARPATMRIGQVAVVEPQGGVRQYHVALADGLAAVTEIQAEILLGDPDTPGAQQGATRMTPAEYAVVPHLAALPAEGLPANALTPARSTGAMCSAYKDATGLPELSLDVPAAKADDAPATGGKSKDGTLLADRVVVEPGRGALVAAMSSPDAAAGSLSVVTDLGVRYSLPTPEVQSMLGYGAATPVRLPAGLVSLVPAGRALDPAAALSPVVGTD